MNTNLNIICEDFSYIKGFLKNEAGIVIDEDKLYLVESRLSPILKNEGLQSFKELVIKLRLERFGDFHQKVIEAMTTNETSFFRDFHPFEAFKNIITNEILNEKNFERSFKVWSAACSTGQEAYSIAIILNEMKEIFKQWEIKITASDISKEMIDRASRGIYNQLEVNRGLNDYYLNKYFKFNNHGWAVNENLNSMVQFTRINLVGYWPEMPVQDIIFLRHVLIYFDIPTRREILNKIKKVLKPGGYLILGVGETTNNIDDSFDGVHIGKTICYKLKK